MQYDIVLDLCTVLSGIAYEAPMQNAKIVGVILTNMVRTRSTVVLRDDVYTVCHTLDLLKLPSTRPSTMHRRILLRFVSER